MKKWLLHVHLYEVTTDENGEQDWDILEENELEGCLVEYATLEEAMKDYEKVRMKEHERRKS